ncbi:retrovirus-related pol polyprotein from transposon TNT 1-94 [Tanacetum coccineum]
MIYFNAIPRVDIYEIVMSSSNTNESSMYVVSNKRAKLNLDSALLWHCRLRHINKKRIEKLQHDGLLDSTDIKSFENQTTLSKYFWDYALESVARILNMVPTKKVDKTSYEVWHGQAPKLSYLKVWGCEALVKRDTLTKPDKLEPRSINLIAQEASGSLEDLEIIQEEDTHPSIYTSLDQEEDDQEIDEPQSDINPIHRSTRTHRAPYRMCLYIDAKEHELRDLDEPANYKATLLDPESDKWLNAINVEMQSMKDNEVWELVELPPDAKTISHKWLFKKKTDMDGAVHTYKAHLVAKGFTQTPGIDYEETFSPVADIRAIKILIAIAAFYDYEIWPMDKKTSFLNGYLIEENPGEAHWTIVKNIIKYLRNTKDMFLVYGGDTKRELRVSSYTDAGYLTDADDMKCCMDSNIHFWLGVVPTIEEPINMYCDNIGAITIAKDHGVTKGARHFRAKVHYLRETI